MRDRVKVPVVTPNPQPPKPLNSAAQKARELQRRFDAGNEVITTKKQRENEHDGHRAATSYECQVTAINVSSHYIVMSGNT
jgi:hypothetical protein